MRCPVRSRYPNQPQRSFIVLVDANDYASSSRNTNFKPLVLDEIQTVGDTPQSDTTRRKDKSINC
jgi:hypothetical protein